MVENGGSITGQGAQVFVVMLVALDIDRLMGVVLPSPLTMPPLKEKDRVEDTEAPQQHIFFFLTSACMYNRAMVHCLKGIWIC